MFPTIDPCSVRCLLAILEDSANGFTLIRCRSLGVHISKVRSLNLDDWEPESIKVIILLRAFCWASDVEYYSRKNLSYL